MRGSLWFLLVACGAWGCGQPDGDHPLCDALAPLPVSCATGVGFPDEMYETSDRAVIANAIADLDGDGALDIVVASGGMWMGDGSVAVLFGGGERYAVATFSTGPMTAPSSLAIGDLDHDGRLDIVAGDEGNDDTLVLRNLGGRAFELLAPVATSRPHGVALGDLDGDGNLDLAVAVGVLPDNLGAGVLRGNGDGTFGARTLYPTGGGPTAGTSSIALADVDGDGRLDLVVANDSALDGSASVAILRGQANATFAPAVTYPTGLAPTALQVVDLDGDGALDVAVANSGESAGTQYDRTVSVLFNDGTGAFAPQSTYSIGHRLTGLLVTDRNGDGKPDLLGANMSGESPEVLVELINQGDRTFAPAVTTTPGNAPIAIADLDADGTQDLVVTRGAATLPLLRHEGGVSTPAALLVAPSSNAIKFAEDLTGDGRVELISLLPGQLAISVGQGDGNFGPVLTTALGDDLVPQDALFRDLDGDGIRDAAVVATAFPVPGSGLVCATLPAGSLFVLHGNGDGTFAAPTVVPLGILPSSIGAGDFDRDGRIDLAVANAGCSGDGRHDTTHADGGLTIVMNGATWSATQLPLIGSASALRVVELAGDCRSSLAYVHDNTLVVRQGAGDGTFAAEAPFPVAALAFGDFNEDGRADAVVPGSPPRAIAVALGNGDGTFGPGQDATTPIGGVSVADATGDGHLDLISTSTVGGAAIAAGRGDGTFAPPRLYYVHPGQVWTEDTGSQLLVGDIDSDGQPDLIQVGAGRGMALLGACVR